MRFPALVRRSCAALFALALLCLPPALFAQCVSLTTIGVASTQNFDTLSNTAGSTTNNLTITGWFLTETGGGARDNEQYAVDTGASNTGDTYSYGAAGSTERALGALRSGTLISVFGACFTNNTGSTISTLDLAYTGEEWRLGTAARTDLLSFEYSLDATSLTTGAWTGVSALNFITPNTVTVGAKDGNAAGNRTALSSPVTGLSIANGATFWIRWNDTDASGADDGLAIDDVSLTPQVGIPTPTLNINDVALAEGNAGTTAFVFTASLTAPAGAGGVSFTWSTADNSATVANNDYMPVSPTSVTIPAGSSTAALTVNVNGDTTPEPNETFFVNLSGVTNANAGDVQGVGTINNDDVTITPIHDIQGPGASSPIVGSSVTIRGIVTGVKSNGFFVQEEDAEVDADPATSEGILVFTSGAPPAAAAFGAQVQVTGTVAEFVPSADPLQPPLTELTSPTVLQLQLPGTLPLPAAIALTASLPSPAGPYDQLERFEGMRVSVASMTVAGPSDGAVNESAATGTSNGRFHGVVTGVARPFREPGVEAPDTVPTGTIPPIPRWDANPELLRVESAALTGQPVLTVKTGDAVTALQGPLDYSFRRYAICLDGTQTAAVTPGTLPTVVTAPLGNEFTVASYNLQRLFDTVNDPAIGEPVLTAAAFDRRLGKASLAIRDSLRAPDIIGVQEVENLSTLQALASRISSDAIAASQPDPLYQAFLTEGNDVGGIDVGFLVKTASVSGGAPRVSVNSVTQVGLGTTWTDPTTGTSDLLNDRPPLVLDAVINRASGVSFPLIVVNNHLRSLIDVDSNVVSGASTAGDRVRRKRQLQADFLAQYVQTRQTTTPGERIAVIGDLNAFEFNDGYQYTLGTLLGTPAPDNQTVVCSTCAIAPNTGDGIDQITPDFVNLVNTPAPAQRYSYVEDGNAQNLDHVLASAGLVTTTTARRIEHPRIGADYPETERDNAATPLRVSDHDPVLAYFAADGLLLADLSITKTDAPDPVVAGNALTYTVTVTNDGPDVATTASWSDTLPAGTTFTSLATAAGWSCTTPAVGSGGTVTCSIASFAPGNAVFTLVVGVDASAAAGSVVANTATVTATTPDPTSGYNSATATTTVDVSADLGVTNLASTGTAINGQPITYTISVNNAGPSAATGVTLSNPVPTGTTFTALVPAAGWSCTTPAVGATGTVSCTLATLAPGAPAQFDLTVTVDNGLPPTMIVDVASVSSTSTDPATGNNSATATTTTPVSLQSFEVD